MTDGQCHECGDSSVQAILIDIGVLLGVLLLILGIAGCWWYLSKTERMPDSIMRINVLIESRKDTLYSWYTNNK